MDRIWSQDKDLASEAFSVCEVLWDKKEMFGTDFDGLQTPKEHAV